MPDLLLPLPSTPPASQRACLVMVDLVGSTRLAHRLPLGHYAALMAEFVQVMILSFEAKGGQVLQHQGDAVVALWPEDLLPLGVLAALEAHDRAARLSLAEMLGAELKLRAGVACGDVVMGMVGGQLSAYGLPVNLARRLCDSATPEQTLVSRGVEEICAEAGAPVRFTACPDLPPFAGFGALAEAFSATLAVSEDQNQVKVI